MEIHGGIKGALCIFLLRVFKVITVKLATLLQANLDASKSSRFTVSLSIASNRINVTIALRSYCFLGRSSADDSKRSSQRQCWMPELFL